MKLYKCFRMALNMVLHSKLRSWLTILGMVIGVASVISIVGIGEGLNQQITDSLGVLQADIITITPGYSKSKSFGPDRGRNKDKDSSSSSSNPLTNKDIQILKGINDVSLINPEISGKVSLQYLGKNGTVSLNGVDQKVYSQIATTIDIRNGRNLNPSDYNVILIGGKLADSYFDKPILINQLLTIEGKSFRVIGIINDSSTSITMPISTSWDILDKTKYEYDSIQLKIKNVDKLNETQATITTSLMRSRHVNAKTQDFSVRTNSASNNTRQSMISTLTTFLTAIASVSLIVGAVGIANTMFTAVLEKTRDIGIMKSIGARNADILIIFLLNAALIGLVGGIIGVILGYGISSILTSIGLTSIIKINTIFITLGIAIAVGMISGFIPAINASKLNPVEALRRD